MPKFLETKRLLAVVFGGKNYDRAKPASEPKQGFGSLALRGARGDNKLRGIQKGRLTNGQS